MSWRLDENEIYTAKYVAGLEDEDKHDMMWECQTNLFFLANNICRSRKNPPLLRKVHGGICDALIQKTPVPDYPWIDKLTGYTPKETKPFAEWSPIKQRVILSSRGTLKSVIESIDIVQLILCFPDIRILLLSGSLNLAKDILKMARSQFESNEVLGVLFPIFGSFGTSVGGKVHINAAKFTCSARDDKALRDPTISASTFKSVKGGVHPDYIKLDDVTNEKNQATPELVEGSIQQFDDIDPLVEPGGYIDFTGTRWAADDLPVYIKHHGEESEQITGLKTVSYFSQPVWKVKKVDDITLLPDQRAKLQFERDDREKNHKLIPADVDLLWPEKLNAAFLWPMYSKNPRKFLCQYLLNPEGATHGCFTHDLMERQLRSIDFCPMPHRSYTAINWDLSGISGKGDYSVGIVGIWEDTGRLFILDIVMRKFHSPTEMCHAIVGLYKKYNPDFHRIESANGSELLSGELRRVAEESGLDQAFYAGYDPPTNEENAKTTRIMLLTGALENDLIQFYDELPEKDLFFSQFEKFTPKKTGRKDDAPDCLAQMWEKWKDGITVKSIGYCTPSGAVVDFQSKPLAEMNTNPKADDINYADTEFLEGLTTPHV